MNLCHHLTGKTVACTRAEWGFKSLWQSLVGRELGQRRLEPWSGPFIAVVA